MKYFSFPFAFLLFFSISHAAAWCTTSACFTSRTVALTASCIYRCESTLAATIPLGDEEIQRACAVTEATQAYCPTKPQDAATTPVATASTTTNTEALLSGLGQQTAAQAEQAYQNAYTQFLTDLNSSENVTVTTSNIQTNPISEVPWRQLFRPSTTRSTTTQLISPGQVAATTTKMTCTDVFSRNFRLGMSHDEVRTVQRFLNAHADTILAASGEQSKGKETTSFNALTVAGVKKFQQKYTAEILTPVNEQQPTGFWGPFTRKKANELLCAGTVKLELR